MQPHIGSACTRLARSRLSFLAKSHRCGRSVLPRQYRRAQCYRCRKRNRRHYRSCSAFRPSPSEAYLLLVADFPRWEEPSYGGGRLWGVRHPHRFIVELRYADGTNETFLPLRVVTRKPEIVEGSDVYVVPVQKVLAEIRVHDRMWLGELGVCAIHSIWANDGLT